MGEAHTRKVHVRIHRGALVSIFDDCDRYDQSETGGRLVGTYEFGKRGRLDISVSGVIESGPNASRTATSFFQDGEHQEGVFRALEKKYPEIEHLGNWHTHHVNGYPTLSRGDRETYHRIVNHTNHNTNFFYALLVTARNPNSRDWMRYSVKHFIFFRDDRKEYEVPSSFVTIVDDPIVWPEAKLSRPDDLEAETSSLKKQRVLDNQYFQQFQPDLRPYMAKKNGRVSWRGKIPCVDESAVEIIVTETEANGTIAHQIGIAEQPAASTQTAQILSEKYFSSAREAVIILERSLNREIFLSAVRHKN